MDWRSACCASIIPQELSSAFIGYCDIDPVSASRRDIDFVWMAELDSTSGGMIARSMVKHITHICYLSLTTSGKERPRTVPGGYLGRLTLFQSAGSGRF